MKKISIVMMLALCIIVGLFPVMAMASPTSDYINIVLNPWTKANIELDSFSPAIEHGSIAPDFSVHFLPNTEVTISLDAESNSDFSGWGGVADGFDDEATIFDSSISADGLSITFNTNSGTAKLYLFDVDNAPAGYEAATQPEPAPISDTPSDWALEQVNAAIAANIVPAELQTAYGQAATRAEFCALAVALYETAMDMEITERAEFEDSDDLNVQKMAGLGVVNGIGDGKFDPDAKLSREQAAVILARLSEAMGKPLAQVAATFTDNSSISDWALVEVGQMQASGIMGGVGDNMFAPKADYTKEQSIITTLRLFHMDYIQESTTEEAEATEEETTEADGDFFAGTGIWLADNADLSDGVDDSEVLILWRAAPPANLVDRNDQLYATGYIMYSYTASNSATTASIFIGAIGGYSYDLTLVDDTLTVDWHNIIPGESIFMETVTFTKVLTDVDETVVTLEEVITMLNQ